MSGISGPFARGIGAPASGAQELVDGVDVTLTRTARALLAEVGGMVMVEMDEGMTVTLPISAGVPLPVRVVRVFGANAATTATGICALW